MKYLVLCTCLLFVENIDEYTRKSSLTIKHVSSSDEGHYSCTGKSNTLDKFATSAQMFTLTVIGKIYLHVLYTYVCITTIICLIFISKNFNSKIFIDMINFCHSKD